MTLSPTATCTIEDGQLVWRRAEDRIHRASPRVLAAAVLGGWARLAAEDSLRGDIAFCELVPRAHPEGLDNETVDLRWKVPRVHVGWHIAARAHKRLNIIAAIDMGKSEVFTLARMAKKIGLRPDLHRAILSQADTEAVRRVKAVRELLESADYRAVFPHVRPATGTSAKWTDGEFTVARPNVGDSNPTLRACSVDGKGLGARIHDLVVDDSYIEKTTRTADERASKNKRIRGTFISRVLRHGTVTLAHNAWHKDDLGHELMRQGWPTIVQPARNPDGTYAWPARWDDAYYTAKAKEVGFILAPGLLDCRPRSDTSGLFREEWAWRALRAGLGRKPLQSGRVSGDYLISVGADPAHKRTQGRGDLMSVTTLLGDAEGRWNLIWAEWDARDARWGAHGLLARLVDHRQRYPGARLFCEDNGGQDMFIQLAQGDVQSGVSGALPTLEPVNTGSDKNDPTIGITGMFADMANGAAALPCESLSGEGQPLAFQADPMVERFLAQCFDYQPGRHCGDLLMSAWIAWKGLRMGTGHIEDIRLGW